MLTPQEVSGRAFSKAAFGGYNMAMVDEFLDELTDDYTSLYKENAALKAKLKVLVDKVEEYRATEDSMRAALLTAQRMANTMVEEAEEKKKAVLAGADAVYLAGTSFGMRSFAGNFTPEELPKAVKFAHDHGVRVHVTVNTMPRNDEVARLPEHLERLNDAGVDALILADLGAFTLAGKYAPKCERHISTQQSIANYECARAWYDLGAKRVVLAREVSLQEIREMRAKIPEELEVETFCHGAMCVSYSGRCLLSNYMTGRDSNRGQCAQPCRYQYALMEEKRPGEYFPVFEDEKGTYIMNSRDMCMIDHLDDIMDAGIDCIKIEGRAKSAYYAAIVTGAYRHVLDDVAAGRQNQKGFSLLQEKWLRRKTSG